MKHKLQRLNDMMRAMIFIELITKVGEYGIFDQ
jgi:hypothetical protein